MFADMDSYSPRVIGSAMKVHRPLGPRLLKSLYQACPCREPSHAGLAGLRQEPVGVGSAARMFSDPS